MNARKENSQTPLDKVSENQPPDRMAELEGRVAALEKDVAMLKQMTQWPLFEALDVDGKKKRGVEERIGDEVLFDYRNGLINWLEPFWPWMMDRLMAARTAGEIEAVLEAVADAPESRPAWQKRLLQNAAELFDFVWDKRFRKTLPRATVTDAFTLPREDERGKRAANQLPARQIANAMAGVPDIGWRRSLDRCSRRPSTIAVALNTDLYYRDRFGIAAPEGLNLTGLWSRVPKFLQPVLLAPAIEPRTGRARSRSQQPLSRGLVFGRYPFSPTTPIATYPERRVGSVLHIGSGSGSIARNGATSADRNRLHGWDRSQPILPIWVAPAIPGAGRRPPAHAA